MLKRLASFAIAFLIIASPASAEIWKWKDQNGNWVFSFAPQQDHPAERVRLKGMDFTPETMSPETKEAARLFPVTLYSNGCEGACGQAERLLKSLGVPHAKKNPLESKEAMEQFKEKWPQASVPALEIGDKRLSGFEPETWGSALKAVGYGKDEKKGGKGLGQP